MLDNKNDKNLEKEEIIFYENKIMKMNNYILKIANQVIYKENTCYIVIYKKNGEIVQKNPLDNEYYKSIIKKEDYDYRIHQISKKILRDCINIIIMQEFKQDENLYCKIFLEKDIEGEEFISPPAIIEEYLFILYELISINLYKNNNNKPQILKEENENKDKLTKDKK